MSQMTGLRRIPTGIAIVAASFSLAGCIAIGTNGEITSSMGLSYPLRDVEAGNRRALDQLGKLPKTGKLDPAAITGRDDSSFQSVTRLRGAAEFTIGPEAAIPDTPELPDADSGSLATDRVSAIGTAPTLLKEITVSPFDLITNTRDIYEHLIPAELRFKFESLRRNGYEFFHVPITISVNPGTRTDENYAADVRFMLPYSQTVAEYEVTDDIKACSDITEKYAPVAGDDAAEAILCQRIEQVSGTVRYVRVDAPQSTERFTSFRSSLETYEISPDISGEVTPPLSDDDIEKLNAADRQVLEAAEAEAVEAKTQRDLAVFRNLSSISDMRIFSISPLRVTDQRARSLERRIQAEEALMLAASGPISAVGAAAGNASVDRIRRWERNLATITQEPLTAGYLDGTQSFGWRFYPRIGIDEDGDEVGRFLRPGPRDLMVIIAVKRSWDWIEASASTGETPAQWVANGPLPEIELWVDYMPRWIETRYHLFLNDELAPDNYPETNYFEAQGPKGSSRYGWNAACYFEEWEKASGKPRCGSMYLVLPYQPRQPTLRGAIAGPATTRASPIKSATLVHIQGDGFSDNTRVEFAGRGLKPKAATQTEMYVEINPSALPPSPGGAPTNHGLKLIDGPGRIALVTGSVWVKPAAPKPSAKLTVTGLGVSPGEWITVKYSGVPGSTPKDEVAAGDVQIRVGRHVIPAASIAFTTKNAFGFPAPDLAAGEKSVLPVLVLKKGTKTWLEAGKLSYSRIKVPKRAAIGVEVKK